MNMATLSEKVLAALEARAAVKSPDRNGNYQTLCPFHEETRPSFSFHPEKGYKCFACNAKGGVRALAEHLGIDSGPLTVEQIAEAKGIPVQWLSDNKIARQGRGGVEIPYLNEQGEEVAIRTRLNLCKLKSDNRFIWEKGKPVMPYGLWLLEEQKALRNMTIVVEGESDCWTLWHNGFPAIGIPGARNWKKSWARYFSGFGNLYVWVEQDEAGRGFLSDLVADLPDILVLQGPGGIKDPSELYLVDPGAFKDLLTGVVEQARPAKDVLNEMAAIYDMSWQGRCGRWRWDNEGIHAYDRRGQEYVVLSLKVKPFEILTTPEQRRFCHMMIQTGGQVCDVYLADSWVGMRGSDAARELADYGVALTTKQVATLQEFVGELLNDALLPNRQAFRNLGWYDNWLFVPGANNAVYLPTGGLEWLKYYGTSRDADGHARAAWKYVLEEASQQAPALMAAIGAAMAAPFLYSLPKTEFISFLVHLHTTGTGTGKTTILELAAATMGDPRHICTSWDATKVGLEHMLGPVRHMPLFLNELGDAKRGVPDDAVMMLAEEVGRRRGTSGGGLRPTAEWRTIILSTGNSPIAPGSAHHARRVLSIPIALPSEDFAAECQGIAHDYFGQPLKWCAGFYSTEIVGRVRELAFDCYRRIYTDDLLPIKPQASLWALVEIGARILLAALDMDEGIAHEAILKTALASAARRRAEGVDYVTRLLELVQEDMARDPGAYGVGAVKQRPLRGVAGRITEINEEGDPVQVAVLPSRLQEVVRNSSIPDLTGTLIEARERGVLIADLDGKHLAKQVRVGDMKCRGYLFSLPGTIEDDSGYEVGTRWVQKTKLYSHLVPTNLYLYPLYPPKGAYTRARARTGNIVGTVGTWVHKYKVRCEMCTHLCTHLCTH